MTIFSKIENDQTKEPMFFGNPINVARYDQQRHEIFEKLTEKQLSFFWRPEEVDISGDRGDYMLLPPAEQHIFTANLKYQILLDSIQGRSPALSFLSITSLPELENWVTTWTFSESIHSRSYTHIIRNVLSDPSEIFDNIVGNEEIQKRAQDICVYYDNLITLCNANSLLGHGTHMIRGKELVVSSREIKKALYLCLMAVNVLEAVRFYVSFACSFAFAERKIMTGNAGIIRLIARDEALHLVGTQHIINLIRSGEEDEEFAEIAKELEPEVTELFVRAAEQEKDWGEYLFKDGGMIGLNHTILNSYVEYITNIRMQAVGLTPAFEVGSNPIPWINFWLNSEAVQVAPQEQEIPSYLIGQINSSVDTGELSGFQL